MTFQTATQDVLTGDFVRMDGRAGETGLQARQLAKDNRNLHHIWKPLLHEVAAGALGMSSKPVQSHVKLH